MYHTIAYDKLCKILNFHETLTSWFSRKLMHVLGPDWWLNVVNERGWDYAGSGDICRLKLDPKHFPTLPAFALS